MILNLAAWWKHHRTKTGDTKCDLSKFCLDHDTLHAKCIYFVPDSHVHHVVYLTSYQIVNILMNSVSNRNPSYILITGIFSIFYQINMSEYEGIWRTCDSTFVVPILLSGFFFFLINTRCCLWWLLNKERAVFSCNLSAPESGTWHMSGCDKWCRVSVISPGMPLRCPKPQSQMLLLN